MEKYKNPIYLKEELNAEKRFTKFSFFSQFGLYIVFYLFNFELRPSLILGLIVFSALRTFALRLNTIFSLNLTNTVGTFFFTIYTL
jgi:hypothetical protein